MSPSLQTVERAFGDTEASYYLPSRENGVNDMYLHLGLRAPPSKMTRERVSLIWAILRLRHPLWAARVVMKDYNDLRFVYQTVDTPAAALEEANRTLTFRTQTKDQLLDSYLNGPRTLSNDRLTYLIISSPNTLPSPPKTPAALPNSTRELGLSAGDTEEDQDFEFFLCVAHFIGDGMALHTFANHFLGLLGGDKSDQELSALLEWKVRWGFESSRNLPPSIEERLPEVPQGKLFAAAAQVDYKNFQRKQIGGHGFPRESGRPVRTVVPTVPIDEDRTKKMLKTCKSNGVSISAALFALCNVAWAQTMKERREHPIMMYSAINLRPYTNPTQISSSYCFLSIGYFNVVLPSFFPSDAQACKKTFWYRARLAKQQSTDAAKNTMVVSRSRLMAKERGNRSRVWAKEDDEKAAGTWTVPTPASTPKPVAETSVQTPKAPSVALIGLSLLGNLDGMYKHATFRSVKLHTLTTGSRQRSGGMLLFGYTFVGKLWLSLGYDENGFDKEVVDRFWGHLLGGLDQFLLA